MKWKRVISIQKVENNLRSLQNSTTYFDKDKNHSTLEISLDFLCSTKLFKEKTLVSYSS